MKKSSLGRSLKRTLITGLFVVGPMSLTFILLVWFVQAVDNAAAPLIGFFGRPIPGLGLVLALILILAAGMLGSNIMGRHLLEWFEELLLRIPGINWLYRTIKQLSEVFSPAGKAGGHRLVLIEYPSAGLYSLGFATGETSMETADGRQAMTAVFIPTNHMYIGNFVLIPAEKVVYLALAQQEAVQAMLSAGASLPAALKTLKRPKGS